MVKSGSILACDRCGKVVFMEDSEDEFYVPDGWTQACGKEICPNCSDDFARLLKQFWAKADGRQLKFTECSQNVHNSKSTGFKN